MTNSNKEELLTRMRDFVVSQTTHWVNFRTGERESTEITAAGELMQEAIEALQSQPRPVEIEESQGD